jgi:predicted N-acetyltransferase YhbS
MIFKAEEPKDFNEVARITYAAFLSWRNDDLHIHEPDMVALARQSSMYDRELSIVAKENSKIIGHVLLMPSDFVVLGKWVKGVILGPVSVDPDFQRQGIGAKLIEYAHQQAMSKGYEFSLLCGHPAYYPKLGYLQNVFSF